jgi:predicted dithiol-disulfide oxidoreductase (DUF899 family)
MRYARLASETEEYRKHREELRLAEIELIDHRERVARMRRELPLGPAVDDYVFLEGPADLGAGDEPVSQVHLSELFSRSDRPLIVYHLMYGKRQTSPCPMCTNPPGTRRLVRLPGLRHLRLTTSSGPGRRFELAPQGL